MCEGGEKEEKKKERDNEMGRGRGRRKREQKGREKGGGGEGREKALEKREEGEEGEIEGRNRRRDTNYERTRVVHLYNSNPIGIYFQHESRHNVSRKASKIYHHFILQHSFFCYTYTASSLKVAHIMMKLLSS